jgi:tetratricopeptide (TPR) repeat protein
MLPLSLAIALTFVSAQEAPAPAGQSPDAASLVKEGQKLMQASKFDAAEALFKKALALNPELYDANYALGRLLDLNGKYGAAREYFDKALAAATEDQKPQVWTAIGVSWAFEGQPEQAAAWFQRAYDTQTAAKALDAAAATANALARVYLEAGMLDKAEQWYRTGYETAKQIEKLPADQRDLWDFRWYHAQARLAARRGRHDEARSQAAAAKGVLEKGTNPDQASQLPYLSGYLKFYAGDFRGAIADLGSADQADPFILGLIAQAHEKLGAADKAREYYAKVLDSGAHTINAAYSRPRAQKYLASAR